MSKPLSLQNAQFGLVPPERLGALVSAFLSAAPLLTRSNIHRRDSLPAVSCNAGFCNAPEARCLTSTMLRALQKPHRFANGDCTQDDRLTPPGRKPALESWPQKNPAVPDGNE